MMTIEELIKSVEEMNKRRGPKLYFYINSGYSNNPLHKLPEERVYTEYQFMVNDWQTDMKTLEEAAEFILLWEKVRELKWM